MKEKKNAKTVAGVYTTGDLLNKEKVKDERASITLFVLITCMFFIIILLLVNIRLSNKRSNQEKALGQIMKEYTASGNDMESAYAEAIDGEGYLTASQIRDMIYPVGSIYLSTNSANPSTYIGGEWESYGEGRTIVGAGTGTDSNNNQKIFGIGETGGEYTHTLTIAEMPKHKHEFMNNFGDNSGETYSQIHARKANTQYEGLVSGAIHVVATYSREQAYATASIAENGGNAAHNNLQPYIVTYMWKRTK